VEEVRFPGGAPRQRQSPRAQGELEKAGAGAILVSLTHGREHAAAAVLLLRAKT
jgi:phosphopantetheinyl transferase (holo-ACP synthase)